LVFAFYERLSAKNQAVYRRSDAVGTVPLPRATALAPVVAALRVALEDDDRRGLETACQLLVDGLCERLGVGPVRLQVLAARPSRSWGELHGLYTAEPGRMPQIQVWMRTARHKRVVAFRTFLRTVLHEVGHHFDFNWLKLPESFHTEGFFKRESSLFKQLVPGVAHDTTGA
jgi:hypothetical protein